MKKICAKAVRVRIEELSGAQSAKQISRKKRKSISGASITFPNGKAPQTSADKIRNAIMVWQKLGFKW